MEQIEACVKEKGARRNELHPELGLINWDPSSRAAVQTASALRKRAKETLPLARSFARSTDP